MSMKKMIAGMLATGALAATATPAYATTILDQIDSDFLANFGSANFGAEIGDEPGAFSHVFNFNIALDQAAANAVVSTTLLLDSDIDFTSITLDGFGFTQTGVDADGAEVWELAAVELFSGAHFINVIGSVEGASGDGAYNASLNVAAIPEPATWAMMLLGFAVVGGALRRRQRQQQPRVRYTFA